jgi:hypothetical protein
MMERKSSDCGRIWGSGPVQVKCDVEMEPTEKIGAQSSADNQMEDGTPKGPKHTQGTQKTLD